MVKKLPGVYASLNDLSTLPEGSTNLTVGCVLKAKRGAVGVGTLVTSPADLLNKFTLSGAPSTSDDVAFHSALKILKQTNKMYIARAQNGALFGGLLIKKERELGNIISISKENKSIAIAGIGHNIKANDIIRFVQPTTMAGRYTTVSTTEVPASEGVIAKTVIVTTEGFTKDFEANEADGLKLILANQPVAINTIKLCDVASIEDADETKDGIAVETKTRRVLKTAVGDFTKLFLVGDRIKLTASDKELFFTVMASNLDATATRILLQEEVPEDITTGALTRHSIANPEGFALGEDDLFLVTGIDQGFYNSKLGIEIISSTETPDRLNEDKVFTISVYNTETGMQIEQPVMVSRKLGAKAFDGSGIYIEDVIKDSSAYIQIINNENVDGEFQPGNTVEVAKLGGGFDGEDVTEADMITALDIFSDKVLPISILANGSQETPLFQKAMLDIATTRLDCVAFLNNRIADEKATFNSVKAQNIVKYKKETLSSTSYLGTMYAPHVTVADTFNSRTVKIGADSIAIAGWLNVLLNKGIPYAYAGPQNGLVSGATCDWKIGDMSGEATLLNDASINYIAFDSKVGRYYMQTQNTLQVANSSLRNLGAVFNVLDIKETLCTYFKEYLQRPITNQLREEILNAGRAHMNLMLSQDRVTGFAFVDTTTEYDMSSNTLRYVLALALTPYAQQIYLTMNIVNQMFDFSILQSA